MSYVVRHIYGFRHQWLHGDRAARMFSVKQLVLKSNQHHIRVLFFAFTDPSKSKDTRHFRNANGIIAAHGLFLSMCVKVRHRMKKHIMINIAPFLCSLKRVRVDLLCVSAVQQSIAKKPTAKLITGKVFPLDNSIWCYCWRCCFWFAGGRCTNLARTRT